MTGCDDENHELLLADYILGGLDEPTKGMLETHLAQCRECRTTVAALKTLHAEAVPDPGADFWASLPTQVRRALPAARSREDRSIARMMQWLLTPRYLMGIVSAACVVALVFSVIASIPPKRGEKVVGISVDRARIDAIDGQAYALLSEPDPIMQMGMGIDYYEELYNLNAAELRQLSEAIAYNQEG